MFKLYISLSSSFFFFLLFFSPFTFPLFYSKYTHSFRSFITVAVADTGTGSSNSIHETVNNLHSNPIFDLFSFPQYFIKFQFDNNDHDHNKTDNDEEKKIDLDSSLFPIQYDANGTETKLFPFASLSSSSSSSMSSPFFDVCIREQNVPIYFRCSVKENDHHLKFSNYNKNSHLSLIEKKESLQWYVWELLSPMKNEPCLTYKLGSYSYEYCHLKNVKQISLGRFFPLESSLGVFRDPLPDDLTFLNGSSSSSPQTSVKKDDDIVDIDHNQSSHIDTNHFLSSPTQSVYFHLFNGSICPEEKTRLNIIIQFRCHPESRSKIAFVQEVTPCIYHMIIDTPRLCFHPWFSNNNVDNDFVSNFDTHSHVDDSNSSANSKRHIPHYNIGPKTILCKLSPPPCSPSATSPSSTSSQVIATDKGYPLTILKTLKEKLSFIDSAESVLKSQISKSTRSFFNNEENDENKKNDSSSLSDSNNGLMDPFDAILSAFGFGKKSDSKKKKKLSKNSKAKDKNNNTKEDIESDAEVHVFYFNEGDEVSAAELLAKMMSAHREKRAAAAAEASQKSSSEIDQGNGSDQRSSSSNFDAKDEDMPVIEEGEHQRPDGTSTKFKRFKFEWKGKMQSNSDRTEEEAEEEIKEDDTHFNKKRKQLIDGKDNELRDERPRLRGSPAGSRDRISTDQMDKEEDFLAGPMKLLRDVMDMSSENTIPASSTMEGENEDTDQQYQRDRKKKNQQPSSKEDDNGDDGERLEHDLL